MVELINSTNQEFLTELTTQEAANLNGGQTDTTPPPPTSTSEASSFNQQKYIEALGIAYLSPPGIHRVTTAEALLAQKVAWEK